MINKIELIDNKIHVKTSYFSNYSGHRIDNIKHILLNNDIDDYKVIKNSDDINFIEYEYHLSRFPKWIGGGKMIHYEDIEYNIKICLKKSLFHHNNSPVFICNESHSYYFNGIL
jgi:hypothetical protein